MSNPSELIADSAQAKLLGLRFLASQIVEGIATGIHKSPHMGLSVDFREHRAYVRGDELRSIDWKLYGKTDKLFVRQYEDDTNLRANLVVDVSRSMAFAGVDTPATDTPEKQSSDSRRGWAVRPPRPSQNRPSQNRPSQNRPSQNRPSQLPAEPNLAGLSKHEYAIRLAAAIGLLLLKQQDAVGLFSVDQTIRDELPARSSNSHLFDLLKTLAGSNPSKTTGFPAALSQISQRARKRSLMILISDCFCDLDELRRGLSDLKSANHQVVLFQIWHPDELSFPLRGKTEFVSLENSALRRSSDATRLKRSYLRKLDAFEESLAAACAQTKTTRIRCVTDVPHERVLSQFLGTSMTTASSQSTSASKNAPSTHKSKRDLQAKKYVQPEGGR
jgi:uncharacterized protein (DUF58 family)